MTARFRPTASVNVREVGDELVLLDLDGGRFFVARGLGPRLWDLLVSGQSLESIAEAVASRYGTPRDVVLRDVEAFVRALTERGLLMQVDSSGEGSDRSPSPTPGKVSDRASDPE